MRIYLVRHAQEDVGEADSDNGITKLGKSQSRALAGFLRRKRPQLLLSSDLPRAKGTAEILGKEIGLEPKISPLLKEIQTPKGAWSRYVEERHPDFDFHPGGGESVNQLLARARKGWEWILKQSGGRDTAVVCHSIFIKALLHNLGYEGHLIRNDAIANTGVVILEVEGDGVNLIKFNRYRHLLPLRIKEFRKVFG